MCLSKVTSLNKIDGEGYGWKVGVIDSEKKTFSSAYNDGVDMGLKIDNKWKPDIRCLGNYDVDSYKYIDEYYPNGFHIFRKKSDAFWFSYAVVWDPDFDNSVVKVKYWNQIAAGLDGNGSMEAIIAESMMVIEPWWSKVKRFFINISTKRFNLGVIN